MYQLLKTDNYVSPYLVSQNQDKHTSTFKKAELQARIKEACTGHLQWSFEEGVFLASQSWPASSKMESSTKQPDDRPSSRVFVGSIQMLKLFEFSRVFQGESDLIKDYVQKGTNLWLDALTTERDEKSRLWYKDTRKSYIAWGGRRGEGSEWLHLPEYRLGDLIYIWKALKSLEALSRPFEDDMKGSSGTLKRLEDLKLGAHDVREKILQRFAYQTQDPRSTMSTSINNHSNVSFAIAVRRSRERDRRLFYAKDAALHDGIEWDFFENDTEIEAYSPKLNELTKVGIQRSWQNTLQAQGIDHETTWKKPLRYALAIVMASHHISLDDTKSPEKLAELSWERLPRCVMPHGLFADQLDRDTKLPLSFPFWYEKLHSSWATWEVATLMLGRRFKNLELEM